MPNFKSFSEAADFMDELTVKIQNGVLSIINNGCLSTLKELNGTATPVDTGRARNNWVFQAESPFLGVNISPDDNEYNPKTHRIHKSINSAKYSIKKYDFVNSGYQKNPHVVHDSVKYPRASSHNEYEYERRPVSTTRKKPFYESSGMTLYMQNASKININKSYNVYINNNLDYIEILNQGRSKQSPAGFVQDALYKGFFENSLPKVKFFK